MSTIETRPVKITVECSAEWTETITIEVPVTATESEAYELAESAIDNHMPNPPSDEIVAEEWSWVDNPEFLPDPPEPMGEPTDAHWFRIGKHRWITDGCVAVREDSARPLFKPDHAVVTADETGWVVLDSGQVRAISEYVNAPSTLFPREAVFYQRMMPVLEQDGEIRFAGESYASPVQIVRDDEVIAVVAPAAAALTDTGEAYVRLSDNRPVLVMAQEKS